MLLVPAFRAWRQATDRRCPGPQNRSIAPICKEEPCSCAGLVLESSAVRKPLQDRSRHSADQVLDATLKILREGGARSLTTARVAAESGVSNGSIYHRFGSRQRLLLAALDLFVERLKAQVSDLRAALPAEPETLAERATLLVHTYQGIFEVHGPLIKAFFLDALNDQETAERGEISKLLFAQQVEDFLAPSLDEIRAPDPALAFRLVHRVLFGHFTMRTLFHEEPVDDATISALADAVLGVLRHRG
jgi:AcrR family transcriptional regulator